MSDDIMKAMELALASATTLERIIVLANEYAAKTISAERFAMRTYEMLCEYDKQMKAQTPV